MQKIMGNFKKIDIPITKNSTLQCLQKIFKK